MLISLKKYTNKNEKSIGISISIIFFILASILYAVLLKGTGGIEGAELPLIHVIRKFGPVYQGVYGIVIVTAIYTSAIAAGHGFLENCSKNKKIYRTISICICISAIFASKIGFSYLVELLYPVFGLLGLIHVTYIILKK